MSRFNHTRVKRKSRQTKRKKTQTRKSIRGKRKSIRQKQKGGRSTFFPSDMVNAIRTMTSETSSILSTIKGVDSLPHPGPTLGHPISQ